MTGTWRQRPGRDRGVLPSCMHTTLAVSTGVDGDPVPRFTCSRCGAVWAYEPAPAVTWLCAPCNRSVPGGEPCPGCRNRPPVRGKR
jgi:hypothetical protein